MYLVTHAAIGITIATAVTTNPVAAFGIGWLSHYLADFFPHGDEPAGEWAKKGNEVQRLLLMVGVDGLLFLAAFAWYTTQQGWSWVAAAAAVGSFVPDILWGTEKVLKRPLVPVLERFHSLNHNFFHIHLPLLAGLILQALLASYLWTRLAMA